MENETYPPTKEECWLGICGDSDILRQTQEVIDQSWRHGNYATSVLHREADDTYWSISYQVSGDGDYHSLRDDRQSVSEPRLVKPQTVTTTKYVTA